LAKTTTPLPVRSARALAPVNIAGTPDVPDLLMRSACHLEILIPALDEARRLPDTLVRTVHYLEAQPYSSAIVVIDNGSVDRTSDLVTRIRSERVSIKLMGCAKPGKGAAVRRGLITSRARFVGFMDADLATPIETLGVVEPLLRKWPAVVGSRRITGARLAVRQSPVRVLGGMLIRAITRQILPGLADTQCGFKFFDGDLVRAIAPQLRIDGFAFDVEILRVITQMGIPIKEIPVVWSDGEGSKLRVVNDGARTFTDLLRMARARRL
jgi:dolichyl-phosphate beta-glucosyltransferase